jgi:hypothetical protein
LRKRVVEGSPPFKYGIEMAQQAARFDESATVLYPALQSSLAATQRRNA